MEKSNRAGLRLRERVEYSLSTARGVSIEYDLDGYRALVREIRAISLSGLSEPALRGRVLALHDRIRAGTDPLCERGEIFALAGEWCRRLLGIDPFDEQLIAGMAMSDGKLAQMQTGEGKTLAAVFPACLQALAGRGVHVLTANDYLARRDARWMGPIYGAMGLRVASIGEKTPPEERRSAYLADVTYLTAREAGFDFLRDGICASAADFVQRAFGAAIVDEADFILIDEARIPLVIAGDTDTDGIDVRRVEALARRMRPGVDYSADREGRRIAILPEGHRSVERGLGVEGIHEERGAECFARVYAALHARALLHRDVDYVVKAGRVELVDELTGRIADRRQWPYGIQAALEAKEGLAIGREGRVYGTITILHLIGLYERIFAMTATAVSSAEELSGFYGLSTVIIPTVKPSRRVDEPDAVFATRREKTAAIVAEIASAHGVGRPVLVGTASVRESQELADLLATEAIACEVLNARNDEREAELVARAGRLGAVTISTNMAGRGTDIKVEQPAQDLGGLYVIGTNRHESRRIDDQLRGRAGRQGEPGSSRFFVSLEDPLFERYGVREFLPRGAAAQSGGAAAAGPSGQPIADPRVLHEIDRAQSIIAEQNHAIRRTLRKYSMIVEMDRRCVRMMRDDALRFAALPQAVEDARPGADSRPLLVRAFICRLDRFWADHLMRVDDVREGIDLVSYAGRDPGRVYLAEIADAFDEGLNKVVQSIVDDSARLAAGEIGEEGLGVGLPSSTWTYQVDDASPVRFTLAGIGACGIGAAARGNIAAALAAGPLLLISLVARLFRRPSRPRAPDGPGEGAPPDGAGSGAV